MRSVGLALLLLMAVVAAASPASSRTLAQEYPLLTSSPLASARLARLPARVLVRGGGVTLTEQDLDAELGAASADLRPALTKSRLFVLEQLAVRRLLAQEAEQWAKATKREQKESQAARIQAYLRAAAPAGPVTEVDLRQCYEDNKSGLGGASFAQVRRSLTSYLLRQKGEEAQQRYVAALSVRLRVDLADAWVKTHARALLDNPVDKVRRSGRPSLVDFGAEGCLACETMEPILNLLRDDLKGKANVVFVDVRQEQVLGARFGARTIPLQVFFDREGNEVFRHVGLFSEAQIRAKLAELGVK